MKPEVATPRRRDRGKEDAWIREYLGTALWGVLAVPVPAGPPHLNSNLFVHLPEPDRIYLHSARVGALPEALATAGGVPASFTTGEVGRLLPADEALEFSVEYSAVVAQGRCRTVLDAGEAEGALLALLDKYAPHLRPGADYREIVPAELRRTAVYRLDVERWSGKEKAAGEHPGAFPLPRLSIPFVPRGAAGEG